MLKEFIELTKADRRMEGEKVIVATKYIVCVQLQKNATKVTLDTENHLKAPGGLIFFVKESVDEIYKMMYEE